MMAQKKSILRLKRNNQMRNKFIIITLACSLLVVGAFFFTSISINNEPVEIKFRYMAYACGDCYPQYRIEAIKPMDSSLNKFLKKEVSVEFSSLEQEKAVKKQGADCMICCDFFFTGHLKKSIYKGTFFKVEKARVDVNESCCSN